METGSGSARTAKGPGNSPADARTAWPMVPPVPGAPPKPSEAPKSGLPLVEPDQSPGQEWWDSPWGRSGSSFLASCCFHMALMLILALAAEAVKPAGRAGQLTLISSTPVPLDSLRMKQEWGGPVELQYRRDDPALPSQVYTVPHVVLDREIPPSAPDTSQPGLESSLPAESRLVAGGGLEGRTPQGRGAALGDGASDASEDAVERGLRWLAAHQGRDGSWNFNHNKGPCGGSCRNPGTVPSTTGATALALAPFLGAGYTHLQGEHQETVRRGLYYLVSRALVMSEGVDFQEGTMYAQGLSAIVLCEAYAMTQDESLAVVAQQALDFIDYAQDKRGGGWRYNPGEPGDTTVTGWQLMAIKSGQMAGLRVGSPSVHLVDRFLSSVQSEEGAKYGYTDERPREGTTAVGLLCRMYLGWPRSHPPLEAGVRHLSEWGPLEDNMYYNYYATQVMRHWDGPLWEEWNVKMRDSLVATQATAGHESGSWFFEGKHTESGGRLCSTAFAIMTLEVYYRYMPLYRKQAFDGDR